MIAEIDAEIRSLVGTISVDELQANKPLRARIGRLLRILYGPFIDEWQLLRQLIRDANETPVTAVSSQLS